MPKISVQIQYASNVAELKSQIASGTGSIVAMKDAVDRTARSLGGEGLMRAAHNTTAAVQQLGGAAKLTAAEKERVNATLTKAIEKYELLGQKAPPAMREVEQATRKIHEPTDKLNTQMVALGSAIGSFLGNLAYNAVQRLGTAVSTMVSEGARMSITIDSFQRLATGIGQSGDAMLTVTRTATKGLITDLDIMQAANKAMLLGLPVTSREMGTLSAAAVTLGRAMGQDAKTSLNDLITALGRSSPLILDNLGLTVKVGAANEAYARSLGKTAEGLTDSEKKMAFYKAAMDAAKVKTEELGGVQLKFTDQGTRLSTTFTNLVREASRFVSEGLNPLSSGMSSIPDSMMTATVAIGSLSAAVVAGKLAIAGMSAALGTGMGAAAASTAVATLASTLVLLWPVVAVGATAFGAWKLGSFLGEVAGLTDGVERLAGGLMGLSDAHIRASQAARKHGEQQRELQPLIDQAAAGLPKLDAGLKAIALSELEVKHIEEQLTASVKESIEANKKYKEMLKDVAEFESSLSRIQVVRASDFEHTVKATNEATKAYEELNKGLSELYRDMINVPKTIPAGFEAGALAVRAFNEELTATKELYAWIDQKNSDFANNNGLVRMAQDAGVSIDELVPKAKEATKSFASAFSDLPNVIMAAFTGGGDVGKSIGGSIGGKLFAEDGPLGGLFKKGGDFIGSLAGKGIGKMLGSSLGSMMGPLGTMLGGMAGDLIGPLLGKVGGFFKSLFGGISEMEKVGRQTAAEFRTHLGSILTDTQRLEAGNDEWKKSVIAIRDAYLANGLTEKQALADSQRLWEAEKKGGDAAKAVIMEITANMGAFGKSAVDAGAVTRGVFGDLTSDAQVFRDGVSRPIVIPVTLAVDASALEGLSGARSSGNLWQGGQSQKSDQQLLDEFLRNNPGDYERAAAAIADVDRRAAAQSNTPGFAGGSHGQFIDFGAGSDVTLHGRERVVTEAEGRAEARGMSRLIGEVRELRAGQRRQAAQLEEALMRAFTYGPAYARAR